MGKEDNFSCSICFCPIFNENYEVIGNNTKEILDVIFINRKLQFNEGQSICQFCSRKIKDSFNFKCTCIYTEDFIAPFVSKLEGSQINLWEIVKRENLKDENTIANNQQVCRLCLQIIKGPAKSLLVQTEFDMIERYMPEIAIHNTFDPVACEACAKLLHEFVTFAIICGKTCEKKNKQHENEGYKNGNEYLGMDKYNLTVDECKQIVNDMNVYSGTAEEMFHSKHYSRSPSPSMLSCDKEGIQVTTPILQPACSGKYKQEIPDDNDKISVLYDLDLHMMKYKALNDNKHENKTSNYKNKPRKRLKKHQNSSKTKTYNCEYCAYNTTYLNALKSHMLSHTDPALIKFYHCDLCDYKTKYSSALKSHKLNHKSPAEIKMRKCNQCSYQTKHRTALVTHMLKHKKPSEIQMFKCDRCKFQTKFKQALKPHKRKHQGDT